MFDLSPGIAGILVIVLPVVLAVINARHWASETKQLVALAFLLASGALIALAMGMRDFDAITLVVLAVLTLGGGAYHVENQLGLLPWVEENIRPNGLLGSGTPRRDGAR